MIVTEHTSLIDRIAFGKAYLRAVREMILRRMLADWHGG